MKREAVAEGHPEGEEDFVFTTGGGRVALRVTSEALTPYGGLVPWAAFIRRAGVFERLAQSCPVERTSNNAAPVLDILHSFALTALCAGTRFAHVQRLREDPSLAELFGMERVVSDDTLRRLFRQIDAKAGAEWVAQAQGLIWGALPDRLILDWDSTVQTKYGHQEDACVGYNPAKPGRKSFHPLMAIAAGTRLCASYHFRAGDTVTSTGWAEAFAQARHNLGARKIWLNRGDLGLGHEAIMAEHERQEDGPRYLFKLKLTRNVRRALAMVRDDAWQGPAQAGVWQVAEARVRLPSWSDERRVVFARKLQGDTPVLAQGAFWTESKHELAAYVTDLPLTEANAWQVQALYRERADAENVFDELKNQWGLNGFAARSRNVSSLAAHLLVLTYNLWTLFCRLLEPSRHLEAAGARRWFLLIAGKLVRSGRQLAVCLGAQGEWWQRLRDAYHRVALWLASTAPQLPFLSSPLLPSSLKN